MAGVYLDGFSGLPRNLTAALRQLGDIREWALPDPRPSLVQRALMRAGRALRRETLWEKDPQRCATISGALDERARTEPVDAILVIGSESCAFCETKTPLFGFGDSVFGSRIGLYADQRRELLSAATIRNGIRVQQLALDRIRSFFITSRWAWDRGVAEFGYKHADVVTTLVGANMPHIDTPPPLTEPRRFVWVGLDWERKRGDFAMQVVAALRAQGWDSRLDVVGSVDVPSPPEWVRPRGRLSAATGLGEAYGGAAALLLPTAADLTPVVIAEAAMYGRATIASPVGGIPEMVADGLDAVLLDSQDPQDWARAIASADLRRLGAGARRAYDEHLNWRTIARMMMTRMEGSL
jgi:glycosyltransferase involved in cell wall biosynthesis